MKTPPTGLPDDVIEALRSGSPLEALRRLRSALAEGPADGTGAAGPAPTGDAAPAAAGGPAQAGAAREAPAAVRPARAAAGGFDDEAADGFSGFAAPPPPPAGLPMVGLPAPVLDALQRGRRLEAIKRLRESSGLGLAEARALIERHLQEGSALRQPLDGRSPGEVPGSSEAVWMLVVALLAGFVVWQWWHA